MPLEKLANGPQPPCRHPEHNPPTHVVLEPGLYQWKCPECSHAVQFRVTQPTLSGIAGGPSGSKVIVGTHR